MQPQISYFKRPNSPFWWIRYTMNGAQVRRSLRVPHQDSDAPPASETIIGELLTALHEHPAAGADAEPVPGKAEKSKDRRAVNYFTRPNSPYWWIRYSQGGQRTATSSGIAHLNRSHPAKDSPLWELIHQIEDRLMRQKFGLAQPIVQKPIKDFLVEYINSMTDIEPTTRRSRDDCLRHWRMWCDEQSIGLVSQVNSTNLMAYVDHIKQKNSPLTVRNKLNALRQALAEAKRRNYIQFDDNPLADVKIHRSAKVRTQDCYNAGELRLLFAITKPEWFQTAIRIAACTGCRRASVIGTHWKDVDFDLHTIGFDSKTGQYAVAMHPELETHLFELKDRANPQPDDLVIPHLAGKSEGYLSCMFSHHAKKAGVDRGSFHWFRHTMPGKMQEAGIPMDVRQKILNHKSAAIHRDYMHMEAAQLREQILKVKFVA